MNNLAISWIRTIVPVVVGSVVAFLVSKGVAVPPEVEAWLVSVLTLGFTGLYYFMARKLEQQWPKLGWLLGVASQPKYKK